MTLTIKVDDISRDYAADIVKACSDVVEKASSENPEKEPVMEFKYEEAVPSIVFRGESTPFSRYINSAQSRG